MTYERLKHCLGPLSEFYLSEVKVRFQPYKCKTIANECLEIIQTLKQNEEKYSEILFRLNRQQLKLDSFTFKCVQDTLWIPAEHSEKTTWGCIKKSMTKQLKVWDIQQGNKKTKIRLVVWKSNKLLTVGYKAARDKKTKERWDEFREERKKAAKIIRSEKRPRHKYGKRLEKDIFLLIKSREIKFSLRTTTHEVKTKSSQKYGSSEEKESTAT